MRKSRSLKTHKKHLEKIEKGRKKLLSLQYERNKPIDYQRLVFNHAKKLSYCKGFKSKNFQAKEVDSRRNNLACFVYCRYLRSGGYGAKS